MIVIYYLGAMKYIRTPMENLFLVDYHIRILLCPLETHEYQSRHCNGESFQHKDTRVPNKPR